MIDNIDGIDDLILSLENAFPRSSKDINYNGLKLKNELRAFFLHIQKDSAFLHLKNRDENICIFQHIVEFPKGVNCFEQQIIALFYNLSQNILSILSDAKEENTDYQPLAKLLEAKDLGTYFNSSEFSKEEEEKLTSALTPVINNPDNNYILQAMSATYSDLNIIAQSLLTLFCQNLSVGTTSFPEIIEKAKNIEIQGKKGTTDSLTSNNLKHEKNRLIRDFAIKNFINLPDHLTIRPIDAINLIVDDVIEFSLSPDVKKAAGNFQFYNEIENNKMDELKIKENAQKRPKANLRNWIAAYKSSLTIKN